ncbi:hypothetical protein O3G_MSEX014773 [Manduca sexta]|uniref:Uncharacterized protein n=1 Tax=Manduca sexta TaxID=7130 RepID=A0A921ZVE9_MANSE|nr:hypothetical protein O3G_MSEX014773 [Manduca sexta]
MIYLKYVLFIFISLCVVHAANIFKNRTTKTIDNEEKSPFTLTKLDNESVKKNLDNFVMVRRLTHFTMPDNYDVPNLNYENKTEISNSNKVTGHKNNQIKKIKHFEYDDTGINDTLRFKNRIQRIPDHNTYFDKYSITKESMETSENSQNVQLYEVLTKQTEFIRKFAKILEFDEYLRQSKHDFEDLLKDIEEKRNITILESDGNNTTESVKETTTVRLPTIMAVVDETAVREALKSDPFVKRILKMAAKRREAYVKAAKKYFQL